jgi:dTDP-glucose pyrophosphorylase
MTVIVTMAGAGSRFINDGFKVPKYEIIARDKSLFEWSLLSLKDFSDDEFVFVCLESHDDKWIHEKVKKLKINKYKIIKRKKISKGQAETVYELLLNTSIKGPVWIYNIDTYIENGPKKTDINGYDGCIHLFTSSMPGMSYVVIEKNGTVTEIAEKKLISNYATIGLYGFRTAELFKINYEEVFIKSSNNEVNGERYVAPIYQNMIEKNNKIKGVILLNKHIHILGTPEDVLDFDPEFRKRNLT